MDYIYEVLVPETAMRLIREDFIGINSNITLKKAHEIMVDSREFGEYLFNIDDD